MITIVENFIPKQYQDFIESHVLASNFPLYLNDYTINPKNRQDELPSKNIKDSKQFLHDFYNDNQIKSNSWQAISPICFEFMKQKSEYSLVRAKLNINMQSNDFKSDEHYVPHTDIDEKDGITGIYYVSDSDGDTLFFDKEFNVFDRFTPKKGSFVYFDSNIFHAGQPPKKNFLRCLINFNFVKNKGLI
jgi:hypothetical protein